MDNEEDKPDETAGKPLESPVVSKEPDTPVDWEAALQADKETYEENMEKGNSDDSSALAELFDEKDDDVIDLGDEEEFGSVEEPEEEDAEPEGPSKSEILKSIRRDVSRYIKILIGTDAELGAQLDEEGYTAKEILKLADKDKEFPQALYSMALAMNLRSKQQKFMEGILHEMRETKEAIAKLVDIEQLKESSNTTFNIPEKVRQAPLTGKRAEMAVIGMTRGVKKIYLPNSGFHIRMRPLSLGELYKFFESVDAQNKELGRMLGEYSFLIMGILLRENFMELIIENTIVRSNLIDWDKPGVLLRNIRFPDHITLYHAAAFSLFPEGMEIATLCSDKDCRAEETTLVDLEALKLIRRDKLSDKAYDFLNKSALTEEEATHYADKILGFNTTYTQGDFKYYLEVPTMERYFNNGKKIYNWIVKEVYGEPLVTKKQVSTEITVNLYHMLSPWIKKVEAINEDGEVQWTVESAHEARKHILDPLFQEEYGGELYVAVEQFIRDSQLVNICYSGLKCPKCGKEPTSALEDYIPVDIETHFFYLSYHLLIFSGMELN